MRTVNATYKALLLLTLFFTLLAALSFAAFRETKKVCNGSSENCRQPAPVKNSGSMLWDDFSRRFVSVIFLR